MYTGAVVATAVLELGSPGLRLPTESWLSWLRVVLCSGRTQGCDVEEGDCRAFPRSPCV